VRKYAGGEEEGGHRSLRKKAVTGEGCRCATKPPMPRLAAVEAAEQDQNFRVAGGVLAGVGEEGCRRGKNRRMA
jgi:hypothetical protein